MGMGLLYGSPIYPLSQDWYRTADSLVFWIQREVPSFVGNVPIRYTQALVAEFRKSFVPEPIVRDAFSKLEKKGVRFEWGGQRMFGLGAGVAPPEFIPKNMTGVPPPPPLAPITRGEAERMTRFTLEEYERRYVLALRTNDFRTAEAVLAAVLGLLWGLAKGYAKLKGAEATNQKISEEEDLRRAIDREMDRARTLQSHVKQLSREETRELSRAATPPVVESFSRKLAERITTITVPPSRRGRGRK